MKKITILIPTRLNDGRAIPDEQLTEYVKTLVEIAGGCRISGIVTGYWIHQQTLYEDKCLQMYLLTDDVLPVKDYVTKLGYLLEQQTMYFEVTEAEVEFIKTGSDNSSR